jgi:hypothetical protein
MMKNQIRPDGPAKHSGSYTCLENTIDNQVLQDGGTIPTT